MVLAQDWNSVICLCRVMPSQKTQLYSNVTFLLSSLAAKIDIALKIGVLCSSTPFVLLDLFIFLEILFFSRISVYIFPR